MMWICVYCSSCIQSDLKTKQLLLLACPTSFPASSGSYSDCTFNSQTGRVFDISSSTLTLQSCVFTNCSSSGSGGCIYSAGTISVYSCHFTSCQSTESGGAICTDTDSSYSLIEHSRFDKCIAHGIGGGICVYHGECTVKNSDFTSCQSTGNAGGAIDHYYYSILTLTDCTFVECVSVRSDNHGGGAVECKCGIAIISVCSFDLCIASGGTGGALCLVGWTGALSVTISECEIRRCQASKGGGGISCWKDNAAPSLRMSRVTITNCSAGWPSNSHL